MLETLLYVSFSTLFMPDDEAVVTDIVRFARRRNAQIDVTGALVFTHQRFAQYLEGPEWALAEVMADVRRDPRHRDIEVVASAGAERRRFQGWDMAYAGPSVFVRQQVDVLVGLGSGPAIKLPAERIIRLMTEFARHDEISRTDVA